MRNNLNFLLLSIVFFLMHHQVKSQVVIGSTELEPVKGALLELKEFNRPDNTTVSKGGLVLSRVRLQDMSTLEPFIRISDPEWAPGATQDQTRRDHIGLVVFNQSGGSSFRPGFYVWNGQRWTSLVLGNEVLQLPAFPLKWTDGSVNLFEVYKKNFIHSKLSLPNPVTDAADFEYLLAGYNTQAFKNIHIDRSTGRMTYEANGSSAPLPEASYINIILVRKK